MLKDVTHGRNETWFRCKQMKVVSRTQENYFKNSKTVFFLCKFEQSAWTPSEEPLAWKFIKKKNSTSITCNKEFIIHLKKKKMDIAVHFLHWWGTTLKKSALRFRPGLNSCPFGKPKPRSWAHRPVGIATCLTRQRRFRRNEDGWIYGPRKKPKRSEVSHLAKGITSPAPEFLNTKCVSKKFSGSWGLLPYQNSTWFTYYPHQNLRISQSWIFCTCFFTPTLRSTARQWSEPQEKPGNPKKPVGRALVTKKATSCK